MGASDLFITSALLTGLGVRHGFSLRTGGVSTDALVSLNLGRAVGDAPENVAENLRRFAGSVGFDPPDLRTVNQVHGDQVALADETNAPVDADAVVVTNGRTAGVRTADCVPILLYDPMTGVAAAVHAGWRGTVSRVVVRALEALARAHGVRASDVRAAIGPRIGRCCFFVGQELADRFVADVSFGPAVIEPGPPPRVDLALANELLLRASGVEHVDTLPWCTSCRPDLFFSHRRDHGQTGRHLAVISARAATSRSPA
jgi:YfiH family protein